jgi:hypothetical protein
MKTTNEINKDIMATTLEIQKYFPELSKYINEMPVTIPNEINPEITAENLKDYSESLNALVTKYSKENK